MKIYTKTGDYGETSLFNGIRVKKNNMRVIAYGTIDEVNSNIGILFYYIKQDERFRDIAELLLEIQNQLFILGSDLANPNSDTEFKDYPRIKNDDILYIENSIDKFEKTIDPLRSFILPGGSLESSYCHIIRTIIRRAEVNITSLFLNNEIDNTCLIYLNRLSDLFFVLSRIINKLKNISDIPWKTK